MNVYYNYDKTRHKHNCFERIVSFNETSLKMLRTAVKFNTGHITTEK